MNSAQPSPPDAAIASASDGPEPTPRRSLARRLLQLLLGLLLLALLVVAGLWLFLRLSLGQEPGPVRMPLGSAAIPCPGPFPRQGANECGAYSLAFGIASVTGREIDPEAVVARVTNKVFWSEAASDTLPRDIVAEARREGLSGEDWSAASGTPELRRLRLAGHLRAGRPCMVLIESDRGIQHYVLVVGIDGREVHLYDPNADPSQSDELTPDLNEERPGNRSLSHARFEEVWSAGGVLGLYRYWYFPLGRAGS